MLEQHNPKGPSTLSSYTHPKPTLYHYYPKPKYLTIGYLDSQSSTSPNHTELSTEVVRPKQLPTRLGLYTGWHRSLSGPEQLAWGFGD